MLDPQAKAVLDLMIERAVPPTHTLTPAQARAFYLERRVFSQPEAKPMAEVRDLSAPGPHGAIALRLYRPAGASGAAPTLVYFHGGGWVIGDIVTHEVLCTHLAAASGCAVVSVDYRMGPEHRFPAAPDDVVAATRWLQAQAASLNLDASRFAVGGDSAGGNLAAVVALALRDAGDAPALKFQLLIYPATDFAMSHPSHREPETSILLTHSVIKWFCNHYLNSTADIHHWKASPARAETLAGLPPSYVMTAGADPLRDEGDEYAARLKQAGVPVTYRHFPGQFHGFFTMGKLLPQANVALSEIAGWLKAMK